MKNSRSSRRGGSSDPPAREGQRGQTLLEFALVAPLMLFFVLALVDFGIAIDRKLVLDHAAREGARFASVAGDAINDNRANPAAVEDYTDRQSQYVAEAVSLCYRDTNGNDDLGDTGDEIRVTVHYDHDFVTGFTSIFDPGFASINLDASASARVEQRLDVSPGDVLECLDG